VPGRDGGPDAAPKLGLASVGGFGTPSVSDGRPGVLDREPGRPIGGGIEVLRWGADVGGIMRPGWEVGGPGGGGGIPPLELLPPMGGPFGGGGVAVARSGTSLGPAFLLTHLPWSGS
jgi:hypothetical protein